MNRIRNARATGLGFALLLPPVRQLLKPLLRALFRRVVSRQAGVGATVQVWSFGAPPVRDGAHDEAGPVIEGEVVEVRSQDRDA